MKPANTPPHLLRVDRTLLECAPLVAALRQDGRRAGFLDWSPGRSPEGLAAPEAAEAGVLRSVTVDAEQTVAVKKRRGEPVLRDVLRESFRGCAVVLVGGEGRSAVEAPLLEPLAGESWRIVTADGAAREMSTEQLAAALRRPRPFA